MKKFIFMKRFETYLIADLIADFDVITRNSLYFNQVCDIPWLKIKWSYKWKNLIHKQNEIYLKQLLPWLFNEFIIPFIRANFYVTERHGELNKIFYYRQNFFITKQLENQYGNQFLNQQLSFLSRETLVKYQKRRKEKRAPHQIIQFLN